jgi:thioredoxin 1
MASEKVKTFTDNNFDDETSKGVVLVDFWAEWCGPCKALTPVIDELARDYSGKAKIGKVNTDENRQISVRFSVSAIPTVMLFHNGQVVEKFVGLRGKKEFQSAIDRLAAKPK